MSVSTIIGVALLNRPCHPPVGYNLWDKNEIPDSGQ